MSRLVLDLADTRPIFALPHDVVTAIRTAVPDWDVAVIRSPTSGTGDGVHRASSRALEAVQGGAEVYMGFGVPAELLREGPSLRWVHSGAAGVRGSLTPELVRSDVVFTNSAGIHGPPVAETVIGYLLHFARGLDLAVRSQAKGRWDKSAFDAEAAPVRELASSTVGIVGLGGIGQEVAQRARALGARVMGTRRRPVPVDGVEVLTGDGALDRVLAESHYVVLTVPETEETTGLMDAATLARMRTDAVLVNVSRGGLVDDDALLEALEGRRLRGAALDTFSVEPLPEGHPLWTAPRTLITPHTSAYTHRFWDREAALLLDNLRRYRTGEPLRNVVDKVAGY
ncbi:MAG: D-2-hydroxyacid dehydrogenase [Longimicrobiales bacterium]|nr:D-2-hydroxyacid dehydrogenase [Longimicrobiales bacterium]